MALKNYNCIVFFLWDKNRNPIHPPLKYRKVNNIEKFARFIQDKWPQAYYFNYYDRDEHGANGKAKYCGRVYVQELKKPTS